MSPQEMQALLADLNKDFPGKAKRTKREPSDNDIARERNKKWHAGNKPLEGGAIVARANPEDSNLWRAIARVTYVYIQECRCCGEIVEYTGSEYIKFRSVFGKANGGEQLRKAEHCIDLFLMNSIEEPLEDTIEWHYEKVQRCPGCIRVEAQAQAILWDAKLLEEAQRLLKGKVLDLTNPLPRSMEEALKPSERENQ